MACLTAPLGVVAYTADLLDELELITLDARFSVRDRHDAPKDIAIVGMDSLTLKELDVRPPLPRSFHARLIDRLRQSRPELIAYDVQFLGRTNEKEDQVLLDAVKRARPVVLATHDVDGAPLRVPAGERRPERIGAVLGGVELLNDTDGKVRQMPYRIGRLKPFAVAAAETAAAKHVGASDFPEGADWIDYTGPPGTVPTHSFSRVLAGHVPKKVFRNRIVIVGATDPVFQDVVDTPASADPMPGAEVHANSIATILRGFPLREASGFVNVLLVVTAAMLTPLIAARFSATTVIATALCGFAALLIGVQLAFNAGEVISVIYPAVALVAATAGSVTVDFFVETRERRRLRRVFSRFVPRQVVDDVVARADEDLRLGGETMEATVLFCDLRGFTAFAESHTASMVIDALNNYLSEMSEAILQHGGTVVSYMGDGVMAVFGAPIEQADNAKRALAAAVDMRDVRLPRFNQWIRQAGLGNEFRIGIGLATGPVRSGNVGSQERMEYTAVGDTTNVAARLEAKSKELGHELLVAESTRRQAAGVEAEFIYLGEHSLAGRRATAKLWTVGTSGASDSEPISEDTLPSAVDV